MSEGQGGEEARMWIHELVERCRDAATREEPTAEVMEVLAAFLHQPGLAQQLGTADRSTYEALYRGRDLLVLHGVVPPTPRPVDPHDHRMWAVIGVYHGQEDNQLFARVDGALEPTERFSLRAGDVRRLDASTIHSVQAADGRYMGAVHVYGGDLFATPRSTWRDGVEQPNDESALPALFARLRTREQALGRAMSAEDVAELLSSPASGDG
jgi:predicted metal-dependent enzyme (double-stranded beta helix superfamily)